MFDLRRLLAVAMLPAFAAPAPRVVPVTFIDYGFETAATLPAGVVTFKGINKGKEDHHGMLIKLAPGKTMKDLAEAMAKEGPPPSWITLMGGPQSGGEVTMTLPAGNYAWICVIPGPDGKPHIMKGMVKPLTVTASKAVEAAPVADVSATMKDYGWTFSKPLTAGHHVIKLETAPGQPHEIVFFRLAPGKTTKDFLTWAQKQAGPLPGEVVSGIAPLGSGVVNYLTVDLKAGNYVLLCFIPDAKDGKAHLEHGMMQELSLK